MTALPSRLGKLMAGHRQAQHITQRVVGHAIGISTTEVSDIEHGRRWPSLCRVRKLASLFQVDEQRFIDAWVQRRSPETDAYVTGVHAGRTAPPPVRTLLAELIQRETKALVDRGELKPVLERDRLERLAVLRAARDWLAGEP